MWLNLSWSLRSSLHSRCLLCNTWPHVSQVPLQCPLSWVVLPIVEIRQVRRLASEVSAASGAGRGRGRGRGHKGRARVTVNTLRKKGLLEKAIVYRKWPHYAPHKIARALVQGGGQHLLKLGRVLCCFLVCCFADTMGVLMFLRNLDKDWAPFWESARGEMWQEVWQCLSICLSPMSTS